MDNTLESPELMELNSTHNPTTLMHPVGYTASAVVLSLIGFFGGVFNFLVIIVLIFSKNMWNPTIIMIFNLEVSDFVVAVVGIPYSVIAAINHGWPHGKIACTLYGFFMALFGINSILTLSAMSLERYCLIQFPCSSRQWNNRDAIIISLLVWLYSLALVCPPLMGWAMYVNEAADISCSVNWETRASNSRSYIIFLFIFGFFIPLAVMIFSYSNIYLTLKRSSARLGRCNRSEKRVVRMIFGMIVAFIVAWSPYAIFALLKQFGNFKFLTPAMGVAPSLFAKSSILYNPIIYAFKNQQIRQAFDRICNRATRQVTNTTINTTAVNQISAIGVSDKEMQKLNANRKVKKVHSRMKLGSSDNNDDLEMISIDDKTSVFVVGKLNNISCV